MIPQIAIGSIFVVGKLVYKYYHSHKKIAVLGLKNSGKTTFQNHFRTIKHNGSTPAEGLDYDETNTFKFKKKNIIVQPGKDLPGSNEAIRNLYPEEIKNSDLIFFLFDTHKFTEDFEYKNETRALLFFIMSKMKGQRVVLLATHADMLLDNSTESQAEIREELHANLIDLIDGKKVKGPILLNLLRPEEIDNTKFYF